jgi:hypothetical protein
MKTMSSLDLGALPTEPIATVMDRMARDHFKRETLTEVNFATTHEQMKHVTGYMAGNSLFPHVVADGVELFPNAFLARLRFLEQNLDVEACELPWMAKDEQRVIDGFMFFRFVRTVK